MDNNQINMWISINAEKFNPNDLPIIKATLEQMDNNQMMFLQGAEFKKPSTIFIIAFLLGWERFFLDDVGLGIVKVITGYGCGIWWLIDIFSAKNRAKNYNFQQFQKATSAFGGGMVNNFVSVPANPVANQPVSYQTQTYTPTPIVSAPQNYYAPDSQEQSAESLMQKLFNRVKYLLATPQVEYQVIDIKEESNNHAKVFTSYLLPLLLIPFLFSFIGGVIICGGGYGWSYDFWGTLGSVLGTSLLLALNQVLLLFGGIYITSLIINAMAGKFGGQKDFNRAFSLVVYAYTPIFLAGIFHIWSGFSWLFFAVGSYGLYLLLAGLRPMMKPADEKADNYSAVVFLIAIVVFAIFWKVLSLIFLQTGGSSIPETKEGQDIMDQYMKMFNL